ncbi:hypothetical protein B2J88_51015 [Rhodococcus sp. SRB_17]|nr:hypothetical protein [Rhodococcus sp. SRB_17]
MKFVDSDFGGEGDPLDEIANIGQIVNHADGPASSPGTQVTATSFANRSTSLYCDSRTRDHSLPCVFHSKKMRHPRSYGIGDMLISSRSLDE